MGTKQQTTSNVIVGRTALGLDECGYGPDCGLTRGQWRQKCIEGLALLDESGGWLLESHQISGLSCDHKKFDVQITFEDGSTETISQSGPNDLLDFTALKINLAGKGSDITFRRKALFTGSKFEELVNFSSTVFSQPVDFRFVEFPDSTSFAGCKFENGVTFAHSHSIGGVSFDMAYFTELRIEGIPDFIQTEKLTDFSYSNFRTTIFNNAEFHTHVKFQEANFGNSSFQKVVFNQAANFSSLRDEYQADFQYAHFKKTADFSNSVLARVFFRGVRFEGQATFKLARFAETSGFNEVQFDGGVSFERAFFEARTAFQRSNFRIRCNFQAAQFKAEAVFENSNFHVVGHFENATFENFAPSFRGCELDTTRLEFSDRKHFNITIHSEDTIKSLGFLKRLSDEHGQTDQALNFNALELRSKRLNRKASDTSFRVITWCYEKFSDYGQSITRPLVSYILLSVVTFLLALGYASRSLGPVDCGGIQWRFLSDLERTNAPCKDPKQTIENPKLNLSGYRAAFEYTVNRATGLLDFSETGKATDAVAQRLFGQPIEPFLMRSFGLLKALASTVLIFLIALGLRNRYRLK
jgi:uncharacterized protein YjbI with pentapeptide repeats